MGLDVLGVTLARRVTWGPGAAPGQDIVRAVDECASEPSPRASSSARAGSGQRDHNTRRSRQLLHRPLLPAGLMSLIAPNLVTIVRPAYWTLVH